MARANMELVFNDIRDNNDKGAREYRVAEGIGPIVLSGAPVDDTDLALFDGQLALNGTTVYIATGVTATTTAWSTITTS